MRNRDASGWHRLGATLIVPLVLFASCSTSKTLEADDLNEQIAAELEDTFGIEATVECPDDVEAEQGGNFECSAEDSAGTSLPVQVTQTDGDGNVDWTMDVFDLSIVEDGLEPEVSEAVDAQIDIECPRVFVETDPGTTFDCPVSDERDREGIIRITALDEAGQLDWELNP